jgi:serpin B
MTSKCCSVPQTSILRQLVLLVLFFSGASAQTVPQAQPGIFLRGNDSFALEMLRSAHSEFPNRNIVIAPLPVSLTFAALLDGTSDFDSLKEIEGAFHFEQLVTMPVGAKMILARFEKPKPYPKSSTAPSRLAREASLLLHSGKPQELWLSAAFLYGREGSLSTDFIARVTHDFGIPFHAVDEQTPQSKILAGSWDPALPLPKLTGHNDFWITSFTHLRTSWYGNTFVGSKREKHDFQLRSGKTLQADFLKSETEMYPYAHTEEFEAVVLTCQEATILFVLPSANSSVEQLEGSIARSPNLVETLLARQEGDVKLPPFHFGFETDLRTSIEAMGVHRIFTDPRTLLSMEPKNGAVLTGVAQRSEITVDENGIRADAGTIVSGVLGGVQLTKSPFHMTLERPFLFLIRDRATNALLFEGAVMNPTLP